MRFDWKKFCDQHRIPYLTRGPNTGRNHISIHCVFCGDADPSEHMGLSLDIQKPVWGCLRNPQHRGGNPRRLVQRLLQCSYEQALSIIATHDVTVPDEFDTLLQKQEQPAATTFPSPLVFPKEFRDFKTLSRYTSKFLDYVARGRGFGADADNVCRMYELRYALTGDYAWRIIIPVYDTNGQLRNWVGRAIHEGAELRYRNAVNSGKALLFNEARARHCASKTSTVFVVEGVWDCMKMDYYGERNGGTSVAILGTSVTEEQLVRLALLGREFKRIVLLMDPEAFGVNVFIESALSGMSRAETVLGEVPSSVEDPGALTPSQVDALCRKYCL